MSRLRRLARVWFIVAAVVFVAQGAGAGAMDSGWDCYNAWNCELSGGSVWDCGSCPLETVGYCSSVQYDGCVEDEGGWYDHCQCIPM
jgi:hypothetical protein